MAVVFADSALGWVACPKLCAATARHGCWTWGFLITLSEAALPSRGAVDVGLAELALTVCPCSFVPVTAVWVTSFVKADAVEQQLNLFAFVWNV